MPQLVEFPLGHDGAEVWIEVEERPHAGGGLQPASRSGEAVLARAKNTFDKAVASVRPAVRAVIDALADVGPDELEITLGIKFTADAHAFIAATGTEATIGVKMVWKTPPPPDKKEP